MSYWIFQGNPDVFDIDPYLEAEDNIVWSVRQRHLADQMNPGDQVFIWRAAGRKNAVAGVVTMATISGLPKEMPDHAAAFGYWINPEEGKKVELRVPLTIENRCIGPKEVVKRDWIREDPILRDLRILRLAAETNYPIKPKEARRLYDLCINTGRNWNREEIVAALWAYDKTYQKSVSRRSGTPVAEVALTIGRAIGGVYNMLMNFRSIDPRDTRTGLKAITHLGRKVWDEFYNETVNELDSDSLQLAYTNAWSQPTKVQEQPKPDYRDFGEAPNDDPAELAEFTAKVRKGQPKFRKNLLRLYDGKCAVSGWGPECVLEAAHIDYHAETGINKSDNGLLFRADLHYLFDAGLLRINPDDYTVSIDKSLKGTEYWQYNGQRIRVRIDGNYPQKGYLQKRFDVK